jgi:hypothetical protein
MHNYFTAHPIISCCTVHKACVILNNLCILFQLKKIPFLRLRLHIYVDPKFGLEEKPQDSKLQKLKFGDSSRLYKEQKKNTKIKEGRNIFHLSIKILIS